MPFVQSRRQQRMRKASPVSSEEAHGAEYMAKMIARNCRTRIELDALLANLKDIQQREKVRRMVEPHLNLRDAAVQDVAEAVQ